MSDAVLAEIAAELYAGPPGAFITSRNARAKDVGDAELAAQIKALRKPSVAAWVVDVFARERADRLRQALQLAEELREAQADLDAATLAQLSRQRRALTDQLAREAVALAASHDGKSTPATLEAVRQTIAAAFFDPVAAQAVASGRLVRELSSGEPVDLDAVVAGGAPEPLPSAPPPSDEVKARRDRRAAEAKVHEAEQGVLRAKRDRDKAEDDARDLVRRIEELSRREGELEAQLDDVRAKIEDARSQGPAAAARTADADAAVAAAERALADARDALS